MVTPNHRHKPFDDARVRRASTLAIDRWHGAPELARIAVRTVGGIVFPGSPLAADKEELQDIAGYWPDIEKSRTEARRLLREAGAEVLSFELVNRNVDQPYKYDATWVIDQWSKIGLHVTHRVLPPVPGSKRCGTATSTRSCTATATVWSTRCSMCNGTCRPRSTSRAGRFDDQPEGDLYDRMLRETDVTKQRALMRDFEKHLLDDQAHEIFLLWYYRILPLRLKQGEVLSS